MKHVLGFCCACFASIFRILRFLYPFASHSISFSPFFLFLLHFHSFSLLLYSVFSPKLYRLIFSFGAEMVISNIWTLAVTYSVPNIDFNSPRLFNSKLSRTQRIRLVSLSVCEHTYFFPYGGPARNEKKSFSESYVIPRISVLRYSWFPSLY
jgi:hypothetical protein